MIYWVNSVSFSPDGKYLASGSRDRTVRIWDVASGQYLKILQGHTKKWIESVSWSPDGRFLASGSWGKTIKIWRSPFNLNPWQSLLLYNLLNSVQQITPEEWEQLSDVYSSFADQLSAVLSKRFLDKLPG